MNTTLQSAIGKQFIWLPHLGYGYYPAMNCKTEYFAEYQSLEGSEVCERINAIRFDTVNKHIGSSQLIDFGIGAGTFIEARGSHITSGYDRDGKGVAWLMAKGCWADPYAMRSINHISFWDAFEHIEHPEVILNKVKGFVFMSLPIFEDCDHVLTSKHYKPNEHFWYFTAWGLIAWMDAQGFAVVDGHDLEVQAGRQDVRTFVFCRKPNTLQGGDA